MPYDHERHHRRSIRLRGFNYTTAGMYFVTICVQGRACRLGKVVEGKVHLTEIGGVVDCCWTGIPDHFPEVTLDAYVVMPNHVHGIITIGASDAPTMPRTEGASRSAVRAQHAAPLPELLPPPQRPTPGIGVAPGSVGAVVRAFKAAVTREINARCDAPGSPLWQRNYWEHIIRNADEYERIHTYITSNPALWAEDSLYGPEDTHT